MGGTRRKDLHQFCLNSRENVQQLFLPLWAWQHKAQLSRGPMGGRQAVHESITRNNSFFSGWLACGWILGWARLNAGFWATKRRKYKGRERKGGNRHKGQCNGLKRMLLKFVWSSCWSGWRRWEWCPQLGLDLCLAFIDGHQLRNPESKKRAEQLYGERGEFWFLVFFRV